MSFDKIFDLTAGVYFYFYNIYIYLYLYYQVALSDYQSKLLRFTNDCFYQTKNLAGQETMVGVGVLSGDTECPLKVCQSSRSSESAHFSSLWRGVDLLDSSEPRMASGNGGTCLCSIS